MVYVRRFYSLMDLTYDEQSQNLLSLRINETSLSFNAFLAYQAHTLHGYKSYIIKVISQYS